MKTRAAGLSGLPRLLMLVLLAFGVAGMHTFGHAGHADPHGAGQVHSRAAGHDVGVVGSDPGGSAGRAAAGGTGDRVGRLDPGSGGDPGTTLFTVCLAVLGALGLLLRVGSARSRRTPAGAARPRTATGVASRGRGPPWTPFGLRLATVSVLRT